MDEADKRQEEKAEFLTKVNSSISIEKLAFAMKKMAIATSTSLGADCYLHAALPQVLLKDAGIEARVTVGFAAWRVGEGDGDVILHEPKAVAQHHTPNPHAAPYHAWLTLNDGTEDWILDLTTYQFGQKARALDAMDGGKTTLDWKPDFLLIPVSETKTLHDVTQYNAGLCFYDDQHIDATKVAQLIIGGARPVDPESVGLLKFIYDHSGIEVVGPNNANDMDGPGIGT